MLEKTPKCTNCGAEVVISSKIDEYITCDYCGSSVIVHLAKKLSFFDELKISLLKNNRLILEESVIHNEINGILTSSNEILKLIPEDFRGNYYYRFAKAQLGDDRLLTYFYRSNDDYPRSEEETLEILQHIMTYGSLSNHKQIKEFISDLSDIDTKHYLEELDHKFKNRIQLEERYDDIPRDVFISYRSTDQAIADQVLKVLEEDGLDCWISSRNLRPNDNINYWDSIQRAIEQAKLFIVISSQDAMLSRDVKREINIATELHKSRLEIKIDTAPPTTFFKVFFDGLKWFDASSGFGDMAYKGLLSRVHDLLQSTRKTDPYSHLINSLDAIIGSGNFDQAKNFLFLMEIDWQSDTRFLWRQLLIEHQVKSLDQLSKIDDVFESELYESIKKDQSSSNQERINEIEQKYTEYYVVIEQGVITGSKQSSLVLLNTPDYVEEIGALAFSNSKSLKRVNLNNVKVIHDSAFSNCNKLSDVKIGDGCIEISDNAFLNCEKIRQIILPSTVISLGDAVFQGCKSLESISLSKRLKKIPDFAFSFTSLHAINLPDSILELGQGVFAQTLIEVLEIPVSLKILAKGSLRDMFSLNEIISKSPYFQDNDGVLFNEDSTELVCYPINKKGFRYEIPHTVKRLADFSFSLNPHLISIVFPKDLNVIGAAAFSMVSNIDKIVLPDSVKEIGGEAFSSMRKLTEVILGEEVELLSGTGHFSHNPKLISIKLPQKIKVVPDLCFYQSTSLEHIILPKTLESIGVSSFGGTNIQTINLPTTLTLIPSRAFISCRNLRNIDLSSIQVVGEASFKDNVSLETVHFSDNLQSIDNEAFSNCLALIELNNVPPSAIISKDAFIGSGVRDV